MLDLLITVSPGCEARSGTISWPGSQRTSMRPIGPLSPMRVPAEPQSTLACGASERSGRRLRGYGPPAARRRASPPAGSGRVPLRAKRETLLPRAAPEPPGSRNSRCMSITTSAPRAESMEIEPGASLNHSHRRVLRSGGSGFATCVPRAERPRSRSARGSGVGSGQASAEPPALAAEAARAGSAAR